MPPRSSPSAQGGAHSRRAADTLSCAPVLDGICLDTNKEEGTTCRHCSRGSPPDGNKPCRLEENAWQTKEVLLKSSLKSPKQAVQSLSRH